MMMKRPSLDQAGLLLGAIVMLFIVALFTGCEQFDDYDRTYQVGYDATTSQARAGGRISRAAKPGTGTAALEWEITGQVGDGKSVLELER